MDRMSSTNISNPTSSSSYQAPNWAIIGLGMLTASLYIASFVITSKTLGSVNSWEKIQSEVLKKIWPLTLVGTLLLFVTSALFILQDPSKTMYALLILCCIAIGFSYSALAISVISR